VLSEQPTSIDFQHYRSTLKNQQIVDEIERQLKAFKPQTYDVGRQLKAIEAFEAQAVKSAEETKEVVDRELKDLDKTLRNIEEARPFEDLTVVYTTSSMNPILICSRVSSRTRLLLRDQTSISAPSNLFRRAAGTLGVIRFVSFQDFCFIHC